MGGEQSNGITPKRQFELWLEGESVHVETEDGVAHVPDFSCCDPILQADEDTRRRFKQAHDEGDEPTIRKMLTMFVQAFVYLDIMKNEMGITEVEVIDVNDNEGHA